jgi:mono/diheme cytochrome c family protein
VVVLAAAAAIVAGPLSAGAGAAEDGQGVFDQLCQSCHTIGGGDLTGPDLERLADRRDRAWVERFIREPDVMIAEGDPIAKELVSKYGVPMPNLGVSDAQLAELVAFLGFAEEVPPTTETTTTETTTETTTAETQPAPTPTTPEPTSPPAPAQPTAGDADRGKLLFQGSDRFAAGGPACLSCHSVAGVGALGGGALGPDLTGAYAKWGGEQGLRAVLETIPFPTMTPIFASRQLTAAERRDLIAFLASAAADDRPGRQAGKLLGLSLGLAGLLVLLAFAIWGRPLYGTRRSLVDRSTGRKA